MCTYSQLGNGNKIMCNPPPPQGVNDAQNVSKLYASGGKDFSRCIESGSMKLTTLVDYIYIYIYIYIYMYAVTNIRCN